MEEAEFITESEPWSTPITNAKPSKDTPKSLEPNLSQKMNKTTEDVRLKHCFIKQQMITNV